MDLLHGEPGSCDESCGTCTLRGNMVTRIETERVSHITDQKDQEPATNPAIKTEPNVSCVPVVSVKLISYKLYTCLGAPITECPCETKI
jgi:hypothetical protein